MSRISAWYSLCYIHAELFDQSCNVQDMNLILFDQNCNVLDINLVLFMLHTRGIIWLELSCPGYQLGTLYVTYTRHYLTWAVMSRIPTWYSLCYLRETLFEQSWSPRLTAAATRVALTRTQSWRRGHHLKTALLTLCERLLTSNCPRNWRCLICSETNTFCTTLWSCGRLGKSAVCRTSSLGGEWADNAL